MKTHRGLVASEEGVVFLEFLVAFIPMWILFLCLVQLAFLSHANLLVRHSSESAARSAAVVLPDSRYEYAGEREKHVTPGLLVGSDVTEFFQRLGQAVWNAVFDGDDLAGGLRGVLETFRGQAFGTLFGTRSNTISVAAHMPLVPLAPMDFISSDPSIANSLASGTSALKSGLYNPFSVWVDYPGAQNGVVDGPEVTVRVSYAYRCSIPVARRIICNDRIPASWGTQAHVAMGGNYKMIAHQSTLLMQDAPYRYKREQ